MNIGEVSAHLKITKKAIKLYEDKGLILPLKDSNGYRIYNQTELTKLQKIKILRSLDFSIQDINKIINDNNYRIFDQKFENLKLDEYNLQKKLQYLDLIKNDFIDDNIINKINDYQELLKEEEKDEIKEKNICIDFEHIFFYLSIFLNFIFSMILIKLKIISDIIVIIIIIPYFIICIAFLKYPQTIKYLYQIYHLIIKYKNKGEK